MEPTRYLKEVPHLGINKYHSPSYHRINNSNNIYDYLYGNVGVSGKHSLPFHQAVNSIDNAGEKMYKRNFNYRNMLRFDKRYNLDDRILDYANDRLMSEWKIIDNKFQKAQQAYESGNITENKFNRLSKKYERNAERYNGYVNNLNNNARHFNIADSINDGRSVVTGKGPLYDSMTKGIWSSIGAGIGAGFAPAILPKVISATPWIMKNMALPYLGGEVINDVTRKASHNKYDSFGDFVYNGSGLANIANDTFMETPLRFVSDMTNLGYWSPYGKISQFIGPVIDKSVTYTAGNIIGEIARRSNSYALRNFANNSDLVPAKLPRLYRAIGKPIDYIKGNWDNIDGKFSKFLRVNGTNRNPEMVSSNITNFSTDQKVINHAAPWNGWDMSDVIVFPRSFTKQMIPYMKSTAPMDTFIQTSKNIVIPKNLLYKVTGDTSPTHFKKITSKKLQKAFNDFNTKLHTPGALNKFGSWDDIENITKEQNHLLFKKFGRPLKKDIELLEIETGLPSGIVSPTEFKIFTDKGFSTPKMGPEFFKDRGISIAYSTEAGKQNLPPDYKYVYKPNNEMYFNRYPELYKEYINAFKTSKYDLPKINIENSTQKRVLPVMGYNTVNSNND